MQQLFPSSQELAKYKILADGSLDLTAALQKLADMQDANINIAVPTANLSIKWSEVRPTRQQADFAEGLVGNRLKVSYFQYLGQFLVDDKIIAAQSWQHKHHAHTNAEEGKDCSEMFSTDLPEGNAVRAFFGGTGFFNSTWLLDFLINPARCLARGEKIAFAPIDGGFVLTLSSQSRSKEVEQFLFKKDFSAMQWEHTTTFA
jgi:hypothetical protein